MIWNLKDVVRRLLSNSLVIVAVAYALTFMFQANVIYPIEKHVLPGFAEFASLVFLPHAVITLGTAIVGPRVVWALFPAILGIDYIDYQPVIWDFSRQAVFVALAGAGCGPLAYCFVRSVYRCETSFETALLDWKPVFLIGMIASLINTLARAALFSVSLDLRSLTYLALRFVTGDIVGLMTAMLLLVFCFRIVRADAQGSAPDL